MDARKKYTVQQEVEKLSTSSEWFVYIIRCSDASLYTGITTDVQRRFAEHAGREMKKGAKYFRGRYPESLVFVEGGHTRASASRREVAIKQLDRPQKLALIAETPLPLEWRLK
ncbi:MAG TPA: GIY-YIG nuclease family protein [Gammaproteobacteria bacterium]|nr:GIY-YIG nuclease family protein [Gammaproteobacteria bacterium]